MDVEAENAIKSAFEMGPPQGSDMILDRATEVLNDPSTGSDRIYKAIRAMVARGRLEAPRDFGTDWKLL